MNTSGRQAPCAADTRASCLPRCFRGRAPECASLCLPLCLKPTNLQANTVLLLLLLQRLERIKRNEQMLLQLGVQEAAGSLATAVHAEQRQQQGLAAGGRSRGAPRPRERRPVGPAVQGPARKSARQRGDRPLAPEEAVAAAAAELGAAGVADLSNATDKELGGCYRLHCLLLLHYTASWVASHPCSRLPACHAS
jgi:hypothetical protein